MQRINRRTWLGGAVSLLLTGCARFAVRPPTPATQMVADPREPPLAGEHYYILVWASQRVVRTPAYTHSFATVVHTVEQSPGCEKMLDYHTISWLPATLVIYPLRLHPEPGANLTLQETLHYAKDNGERVSLWGAYECRPSVYERFLVQKQFIETSGIGYQCADNLGESARTGDGCDCIHAITDADPEYGRANYPLIWFGDPASEHIAHRLRAMGSLLNPQVEHDHVLELLGLCGYPIVRRQLDDRLLDFPRVQPAEGLLGRLGF